MKPLQRIFAIAGDCHTSGGRFRTLWQNHFYNGLALARPGTHFPQGISYDWARGEEFRRRSEKERLAQRAEISGRLRDQIIGLRAKEGLDAVISYSYARDLDPALIKEITQSGTPWINFWCDSLHMFEDVAELTTHVTVNWFPENTAISRYEKLGGRTYCRPYPLNPNALADVSTARTSPGFQFKREAAFVGFPSANRITLLGLLLWQGAEIEIRGHGWIEKSDDPFGSTVPASRRAVGALFKRGLTEKILRRLVWPRVKTACKGPLNDSEFYQFLAETKVALGLNAGVDTDGTTHSYLKFRDIEFPAHGCCYLTQDNVDIRATFEPGREVLTYSGVGEALDWLKRLKREPDRISRVGQAGRKRALSSCSWSTRLEELGTIL